MKVRIIEDVGELRGLSSEWRALAGQASRPFQEPGWHLAWLETIGQTGGRRACVVAAWDENRLVGILPLVRRRFKGTRLLEWTGSKVTDYCDVILDPTQQPRPILEALWSHLVGKGGFDVLRLGQVRSDAVVRPLLERLSPWIETDEEAYSMPVVWPDSESWLKSQSSKSRARVRRGLRRMEELGLRFRIWQPGEPLEPIVESAIRQKQQWVQQRQASSFLTEERGADFVRRLAEAMAASGALHLSCIEADGVVVAAHFGFYKAGTFYYYMPTYDAAHAQQRVGTLLLDSLIRWCCDHGAVRFDMLLGAHDYKETYGVEGTSVQTLVYGRGLLGKAAVGMYKLSRRRSVPAQQDISEEASAA